MSITSRATLKLVTSFDVDASVDSVKEFLLNLGDVVSGVAGVRVLEIGDGVCRCVWSRNRGVFRRVREAVEVSLGIDASGSSIVYNGSSHKFSFTMEFSIDRVSRGSRINVFADCRGDEKRCREFIKTLADAVASKLRFPPSNRVYTAIDPYNLLDPATLATLISKLELLMQKELGPGQRPEDVYKLIQVIYDKGVQDLGMNRAIARGL